jgi:hypothetical protein
MLPMLPASSFLCVLWLVAFPISLAGAGASAIAFDDVSRTLLAVAGAGGSAGEVAPGGAAGVQSGEAGYSHRDSRNAYSGGGGGTRAAGGYQGNGIDGNCKGGPVQGATGTFFFPSRTTVSITGGANPCACGGVGGGGECEFC